MIVKDWIEELQKYDPYDEMVVDVTDCGSHIEARVVVRDGMTTDGEIYTCHVTTHSGLSWRQVTVD